MIIQPSQAPATSGGSHQRETKMKPAELVPQPNGASPSPTPAAPSTNPTSTFSDVPVVPLPSSREITLRRLLWGSLAVSVAAFALSMVFLGFMSFWVSVAGVGCCVIFDITILALHSKELKARALEAGQVNVAPPYAPDQPASKPPPKPRLPYPVRGPALGTVFFLIVVWTGALACLSYMIAYIDAWDYTVERGRALGPVWELVMVVTQLEILWTYLVIGIKERRRILKGKTGSADHVVE